jgi:hypothetical protein
MPSIGPVELLIVAIIWFGVFGGVGAWIARSKGRSGWEGRLLGMALGVIGWVIELVLAAMPTSAPPSWGAGPPPAIGTTPGPSVGPTTWNGAPNAAVVQSCSACRSPVPPAARFCPACGMDQGDPRRCPACGTTAPMGASYCPTCGRSLDGRAEPHLAQRQPR